jgi:hypothetical protein
VTPRTVTLALVDRDGTALGTVPIGEAPTPWWQDVEDVVDTANAHGIDVTVLRLLTADRPQPPGGHVTYVAELHGRPPRAMGPPDPTWTRLHPRRMPWADPGGPAATLNWAQQAVDVTAHHQTRTWNLSAIWRLTTPTGPLWLKQLPPFHHHEPTVLDRLDGPTTPRLIATAPGRMLLADIPGADRYDATDHERADMLTALLDIQTRADVPELLARGVPDHRTPTLAGRITNAIDTAPARDREPLHRIAATLAELDDCGIPPTLLHGDFHPGNVRTTPTGHVILDWADSAIAHPVFDLIRMRPPADRHLTDLWCAHWRTVAPGSDPERAVALAERLAPLRDAATYQAFLDGIETTERPYHEADVPAGLAAALATSQRA